MQQKEKGFTLVELVVSIAIIGVVVTTVTGLFMMVHSIQRRSLYLEVATRAAQREMESLRNNNYNNLTPGQTINFTNDLPSTLRNKSGTVEVSEPTPGLKRVDITVGYDEGSTPKEVKLSSLIGVLGITQ